MINQQDSTSFDDSRLQHEMKQTAHFFNPQISQLGQTKQFQFKQLQRVPFKSPKEQPLKFIDTKNKIPMDKRPSQPLKKVSLASTKSTKQFIQNPVMHKFNSPPKLNKVPSVKPFSPPQPKTTNEQITITQNNSVAPGIQRIIKQSDKSRLIKHQITENEFNVSMADLQPQKLTTKPTEHEYPSYQKSLLDSRQSDYMHKSNSTAFLPRINAPIKKIFNNQLIGYGSIQSQQETALRTNSSKQTITPVNEFISFNLPQDDISRKSRTAQEQQRDSLESQNLLKFTYKLNSAEQDQLPSIQSPQASTKQQFAFQSTGGKPKNFLQRTPQTKIISRLFSSKSGGCDDQAI